MSYIETEKVYEKIDHEIQVCNMQNIRTSLQILKAEISTIPVVDMIAVRRDYEVGDFCLYGFDDGNGSLAIVEIVEILSDTRGIAEVKFHKVIADNTGNGLFHYLLKSGKTMNASFEYLKNITPKIYGERREK